MSGNMPWWAILIGLVLGPTGGAWVSVKVALNGTRERVQRIDAAVSSITEDVSDVRERCAKIEGHLKL